MTASGHDVVVIGGGLHGLSAALHLARLRRRVVILEKSWVGRHASGATAAGVRTLGRDLAEIPISLEALEMWHRIEAIVGDGCGFHAHGQIRVAETEQHLRNLAERAAKMRELGHSHEEIIDRAELMRLVPAISPHCVGALIARRDGAADPFRTIGAFRRSCEAEGVAIHEGCGVTAIERTGADWRVRTSQGDFTAPVLVNAAGAWAAQVACLVGDEIALGLKASMMIVTERIGELLDPVVSVVGRSLSFKQSDHGTLIIGGGLQGHADLDTHKTVVNFKELAKGARAAADLFPAVRDIRIVRAWTGMEAKTKDLLPVIGPSPNARGVFHVFGFSGHGFQLVPIVGAIVADLVTHGRSERAIGAFSAERLMAQKAAA